MFRIDLTLSMIALIVLSSLAVVRAQDTTNHGTLDEGNLGDEALRGLIINRTMTVIGWDFYKSFSQVWEALYPNSKDTLTIVERPTAQFGSEIWIRYGNDDVYHTFLSPARSQARQESKDAVEAVHKNIAAIDVQRKFTQNEDLAPEEL